MRAYSIAVARKDNASATHFFTLSPKPIARFRWKCARLCLFRPQPLVPSFIQIHPSFWDLLAKTTFQIVIIIGGPPINRVVYFFTPLYACVCACVRVCVCVTDCIYGTQGGQNLASLISSCICVCVWDRFCGTLGGQTLVSLIWHVVVILSCRRHDSAGSQPPHVCRLDNCYRGNRLHNNHC